MSLLKLGGANLPIVVKEAGLEVKMDEHEGSEREYDIDGELVDNSLFTYKGKGPMERLKVFCKFPGWERSLCNIEGRSGMLFDSVRKPDQLCQCTVPGRNGGFVPINTRPQDLKLRQGMLQLRQHRANFDGARLVASIEAGSAPGGPIEMQ